MKKFLLPAIIAITFTTGLVMQTSAQAKSVKPAYFNLPAKNVSSANDAVAAMPVYNKAGKLAYSVKRYEEKGLPKDISRLIRNQFYEFDIIGVEEVVPASNDNSIYFVHIANEKEIKTIKVYNGESEIIKEYKKG